MVVVQLVVNQSGLQDALLGFNSAKLGQPLARAEEDSLNFLDFQLTIGHSQVKTSQRTPVAQAFLS